MTIRSTLTDKTAVVEMVGTVAGTDFSSLHRHLVDLLRNRRKKIVLDFRAVDHVDFREASSLAREFELVRSHDGDLKVAGVSPYIMDILRFAGLSDFLGSDTSGLETLDPARTPHAS